MDYYLVHHGILGMKWGVRRFQNKDGSLTSAGKKRRQSLEEDRVKEQRHENFVRDWKKYHNEDGSLNAEGKMHAAEEQANNKREESNLKNAKTAIDQALMLVKAGKDVEKRTRDKERLDLSNMSDKELRERINRENLERQYNNLFAKEKVSNGRKIVTNALEIGGSVLAVGSSALSIAIAINTLKKG